MCSIRFMNMTLLYTMSKFQTNIFINEKEVDLGKKQRRGETKWHCEYSSLLYKQALLRSLDNLWSLGHKISQNHTTVMVLVSFFS